MSSLFLDTEYRILLFHHRMKLFESILLRETHLETSLQKLLKNIELGLYVDASSIEEYADISTLKKRMMVQVRMKQMANDAKKRRMSQVYY